MANDSNEGPGTGTVSRALHLLTFLADSSGPVTVKQVGEHLKVPPSTAHRLLNLLATESFVDIVGNGLYGIGSRFYRVAALVSRHLSPVSVAQPIIEQLAAKYNETVLLGQYVAAERAMVFSVRADGSQKLTYQIDLHRPLSLYWGASGKSILAFLSEDVIKAVLQNEGHSPATGAAPPSLAQGLSELQLVRERGWAVSDGQKLPGARGVAAPIFGSAGVIGCLCLTSPRERLAHADVDAIGKDVMDNAQNISSLLGGRP
ncbi:IclR family transcriptional regulator [uncultured Hydrogenophaga sp.]|uniref:IclR family transcriptional regulator n=1 Tax=uncultured Hydrogenophaga sp. TaxID=199683 RepID=UPI0025851ED6|nr:IclR family transcriptional regulator [uncultured Hydrogenophaga sp.]